MKKFLIQLVLMYLIISCTGKPMKPKPKSMLNLKYSIPTYIKKNQNVHIPLKSTGLAILSLQINVMIE